MMVSNAIPVTIAGGSLRHSSGQKKERPRRHAVQKCFLRFCKGVAQDDCLVQVFVDSFILDLLDQFPADHAI